MRIDVASGKLLGLIGFKKRCWGIEVDPAKIQAILDMPPQKTVKEVQSLKAIRRFISKMAVIRVKIHLLTSC